MSRAVDGTTSLRVLFAGLANHGHIYPMMPLASACRAAGHEVVFATGEEFHALLDSLAYPVHPVGASFGWGWQEALRQHPELAPGTEQQVAPLAAEILADRVIGELLPVLAKIRPDVVVYEPYCPGAALAARLVGIPTAAYIQGRMLPSIQRAVIAPRLDELWRGYGGTSPLPDWRDDTFLDSWPPSLQPQPPIVDLPTRHPIRPVAWSDPGARMPDWVLGPRPRPLAYLALSTVFELDDEALSAAVRGLAALDVDVLAVVGPRHDPAALGHLPRHVRVERFVSQAEVLAHADLVVSHGGSGTFLGALAAGLPQLILPYGADQFSNAADLDRIGAGVRMMPADATAEAITATAAALLREESYRAAAVAVRREIAAMPAPAELVPVLQELARSPAPPAGHPRTAPPGEAPPTAPPGEAPPTAAPARVNG